jgi:hypothetical protein
MKGVDRKNEKYKEVQRKQKGWSDIERENRKKTYDKSSKALNEALNKYDKTHASFKAPSSNYVPETWESPSPSFNNQIVSTEGQALENRNNFELGQFGDALANMDDASGLIASLAPALMKAQTTGAYGQQQTRAGQNLLDFQLKNLKGQEYDRMGDLLSQLGGAGMAYGLNRNVG